MMVILSQPGNSLEEAFDFGSINYNLTPPLLPPTVNEYLDSVGDGDSNTTTSNSATPKNWPYQDFGAM